MKQYALTQRCLESKSNPMWS